MQLYIYIYIYIYIYVYYIYIYIYMGPVPPGSLPAGRWSVVADLLYSGCRLQIARPGGNSNAFSSPVLS